MPLKDWSAREQFPSRKLHGKGPKPGSKIQHRRERMVKNPLTPEQAAALIAAAPVGIAQRVVKLLIWTGMHPAVLAKPVKYEVQLSRGNLTWFRPKTMKRCVFPVPPELEETVVVVLTSDLGKTTRTYQNYVYRAAKIAGLTDVSPLTLRHTAAILRLRNHEPPEAVMRSLRCSSEVLWGHYAQIGTRGEDE